MQNALVGRKTHYNGVESGLYRCSRHTRTAIEYLSESRTFFGRNIFRSAAPYCTASACAITLVLQIVGRTKCDHRISKGFSVENSSGCRPTKRDPLDFGPAAVFDLYFRPLEIERVVSTLFATSPDPWRACPGSSRCRLRASRVNRGAGGNKLGLNVESWIRRPRLSSDCCAQVGDDRRCQRCWELRRLASRAN